jgi:hypothetical protein
VKQYSLYLAGVDVSANLPHWITNFNQAIPEFTVFSLDGFDKGIFTITVKAALLMNPINRVADTQINFKFELIVDPCLVTKLNAVPIKNMEFIIKSGMVAVTQQIPEVTSTVTSKSCGPVLYSLIWDYPTDILSLDSVTRKLTLWTETGLAVGNY